MSLSPTQYGANGAPSSWAQENTGLGHKKRVFTLCPTKVPRIKWGTFKVPPIFCPTFVNLDPHRFVTRSRDRRPLLTNSD